jgi:hypothetical protein
MSDGCHSRGARLVVPALSDCGWQKPLLESGFIKIPEDISQKRVRDNEAQNNIILVRRITGRLEKHSSRASSTKRRKFGKKQSVSAPQRCNDSW